jgi:hypothetical protein
MALLVTGHAHLADQPAEGGVARAVLRQQHQMQIAGQQEARAGDERQTGLACRLPKHAPGYPPNKRSVRASAR